VADPDRQDCNRNELGIQLNGRFRIKVEGCLDGELAETSYLLWLVMTKTMRALTPYAAASLVSGSLR
jgi:hypothetical protein